MTNSALTTNEVARLLGITRRAVVARVHSGALPVMQKLPGYTGAWLFDAEVIASLAIDRGDDDTSGELHKDNPARCAPEVGAA